MGGNKDYHHDHNSRNFGNENYLSLILGTESSNSVDEALFFCTIRT